MPYLLYSVIDTSIISPLVMKVKEGKCYVDLNHKNRRF